MVGAIGPASGVTTALLARIPMREHAIHGNFAEPSHKTVKPLEIVVKRQAITPQRPDD